MNSAAIRTPCMREAFTQSLLGLLLWAAAILLTQPGWSPALLAFGPLVLYPLLFELLDWNLPRRLMLLAFVPALASYGLDQGQTAGLLALPWLAFALFLAAYRLTDALRRRNFLLLIIKCNLIVGAAWLVLARLGVRPLDYSHAIVHATAVHFHYAGFVLPILAWQWFNAQPSRYRLALLIAILTGVPMVAAGITLSVFGVRWFELAAVCIFVAACVWFAIEHARFAFDQSGIIQGALLVSSASLIVAMALALLYAIGSFTQVAWLDIPLMLRTHGPIQVFGFALPGVLAWTMITQRAGATKRVPAVSKEEKNDELVASMGR